MQAQQWLEKCYGDSAPSKTIICRWYAEFKRGRTDTEDAERSGRPNEVVTPETIEKVHQIVFENRKSKLREIADTLKISYGSVYAILHEHLSMRKLLSKWVPRLLTVDQKRQRIVDSERCLELFRRNKPRFCVGMWQWTKPGSITILRSQSGRQPSGLQSVRSDQSGQKRKSGLIRLWPQYFGMLMEFCSSTTFKKVRRSIANVTLANWCVWRTKSVRNGSKWKSALSPRQCAVSQVARYHDEIEWIELRIASAPTIFTGLAPRDYYLFADLKKITPRKEILLQRGSHHRNERLFRGQR